MLFSNYNQHLTLVEGKSSRQIAFNDILYIQAEHVYMRIFLRDGRKILHRGALRNLVQQLPKQAFLQIHRSYIININCIESYRGGIVELAGKEIPVSRTYRKIVRQAWNNTPDMSIQNKNWSVQNRAI